MVTDIHYVVVMLRDRARQGYFEVVGVPTSSPILRRSVEGVEGSGGQHAPPGPRA